MEWDDGDTSDDNTDDDYSGDEVSPCGQDHEFRVSSCLDQDRWKHMLLRCTSGPPRILVCVVLTFRTVNWTVPVKSLRATCAVRNKMVILDVHQMSSSLVHWSNFVRYQTRCCSLSLPDLAPLLFLLDTISPLSCIQG